MGTRSLSSGVDAELERDVVYPFFSAEMLFSESGPLRIWNGVGTLRFEDEDWIGAGELLSVSSVEESSDVSVKGASITLSGLSSDILSPALNEPYQGRVANIYFGMFSLGSILIESEDYLLTQNGEKIALERQDSGLTKIFTGYMDEMNIDESANTTTIELKLENKLIDLERMRVRRFTSGYQRSVFPGDRGLDFVDGIQDQKDVWGRNG